jgi:hypothetical protein
MLSACHYREVDLAMLMTDSMVLNHQGRHRRGCSALSWRWGSGTMEVSLQFCATAPANGTALACSVDDGCPTVVTARRGRSGDAAR